jgi:hypothetical protein
VWVEFGRHQGFAQSLGVLSQLSQGLARRLEIFAEEQLESNQSIVIVVQQLILLSMLSVKSF